MGGTIVAIEGSNTEFVCDDDTILRAALRAGLGFPYSCNIGSCGNCRFTLLEGEVVHARTDAPAWTERDLKKNRWLGCQAVPRGNCAIKVRLDTAAVPHHRPRRIPARLAATAAITHDIHEFAFALDAPHFALPGQYALLALPGLEAPRAYSMADISGDGQTWTFQIKLVTAGLGSAVLRSLGVGSAVTIDGPYGTAFLRNEARRDILCIAGGSGLSPMISIARAATRQAGLSDRTIHFVYGGRTLCDLAGESMLSALPGYGERIRYIPVLSHLSPNGGERWSGERGYVHEAVERMFGGRLSDMEIYFAGPPAMAEAITKMLYQHKVPPEQMHYDEFY